MLPGTLLQDLPRTFPTKMSEWVIECSPSGKVKDTTITLHAIQTTTKQMWSKTSIMMTLKVSGHISITVTVLILREPLVSSNLALQDNLKEFNLMLVTQ